MVYYAAKLIHNLDNPTIVVITDRNDLDDQTLRYLCRVGGPAGTTPLYRPDHGPPQVPPQGRLRGIVFTTIQKFFPEGDSPSTTRYRSAATSSSSLTRPTGPSMASRQSSSTRGMNRVP
jgi:type I site-specific restriction-modification system R (restriction) subunit